MAIQNAINSILGSAQIGAGIGQMVKQNQEAKEKEQEQAAEKIAAEKKTAAAQEEANKRAKEAAEKEENINRGNIAHSYKMGLAPLEEEERKTSLIYGNVSQTHLKNNLITYSTPEEIDKAKQAWDNASKRLKHYIDNPANQIMRKYVSGEIKDFDSYKQALVKLYRQQALDKFGFIDKLDKMTGHFQSVEPSEVAVAGNTRMAQFNQAEMMKQAEREEARKKGESDAESDRADEEEASKH